MDETNYNSLKEQYDSFQGEIEKQIKDNKVSYLINECFLINDSLIKSLNPNFFQNDNQETSKPRKDRIAHFILNLPKRGTELIDDKSSAITCFKDGYNLKLITKKLIELIYDEDILNEYNLISYFAGYNKLIIEYQERNSDSNRNSNIKYSLLIINPFQLIYNNYKSYIIAFKNVQKNSLNLYQDILAEEINLGNYSQLIKSTIVDINCDDEYTNYNIITSLFKTINNRFKNQLTMENSKVLQNSEKSEKYKTLWDAYKSIKKKLTETEQQLEQKIKKIEKEKIQLIDEYKSLENKNEEYKNILNEKEKQIK